MIFRFMEKYRVPILIAVLAGLVFFGLAVSFGSSGANEDLNETYVTVKGPDGEELAITKGQFEQSRAYVNLPREATAEDRAGAALADNLRRWMASNSGLTVTNDELKKVIRDTVGTAIEAQNDGKFDASSYPAFVNDRFRMTPEVFEAQLAEDLRLVKYFREAQRVNSITDIDEVMTSAKSLFTRYKMKGVFFDTKSFEEQAKLSPDDNGNLNEADSARLEAWWKDLSDLQKRRYNTKGALVTAELLGFSFKGKDDEAMNYEFLTKPRITSKGETTLEALTAEFNATDDDKAKLKLRLDRNREVYGVDAETPLEEAWTTKETRLLQEWKILRLLKKLDIEVKQKESKKEEVDLEAIAKENGLTYFKYTNIGINDLRGEDSDYPGNYVGSLRAAAPGSFVNFVTAIGENQTGFFIGPADEIGKHASVWRLIEKELNPIPSLLDAKERAMEAFEGEEATRLRDEAIEAFEKQMDAWLEAKAEVQAVAGPARSEAAQKIAELTKDLDAESDKDKIEEITTEENAKADEKIDLEKEKFLSEAFAAALANPGAGVVVEEGYFLPNETRSEKVVDREDGTTEAKARSYLRKGFDTLQDDPRSDRVIEAGTVSEFIDARFYPGMKGRAMLIEKREPTVDEIRLHPSWLRIAEGTVAQQRQRGESKSMWDWSVLKDSKVFTLETGALTEDLAEEEKARLKTEELLENRRKERQQQEDARRAAEQIGIGAPTNNPLAPINSGN